MTSKDALRLLGLTCMPRIAAELQRAFQRKVTGAQVRMRQPASKVNKDQAIRELQELHDAFNFLKQHLGSQAASQRPRPGPTPNPQGHRQTNPPRPQSSTQPQHSGAQRGGPIPVPQAHTGPKPWRWPFPPFPWPLHPWMWNWVYFGLGAITVMLLVHAVFGEPEKKAPLHYGYVIVPTIEAQLTPQPVHGNVDARAKESSPEPGAPNVVATLQSSPSGVSTVPADPVRSECWVKLLSFPVSRVLIDGNETAEAPGPTWHRLTPGWHLFEFYGAGPGQVLNCGGLFAGGLHYIVKVDLEQRTQSISKVDVP